MSTVPNFLNFTINAVFRPTFFRKLCYKLLSIVTFSFILIFFIKIVPYLLNGNSWCWWYHTIPYQYHTLEKDQLSNYRPISNLSLISKIIERVVKSRLTDHLVSNGLHNTHQSAYCKHHSTETALLYIHDHLINAIGSQKLSCLCLLDLSAAFDTIDHNILITRLSSILVWNSRLCLESFKYFCEISSKLILIIMNYTVSNLVHFWDTV